MDAVAVTIASRRYFALAKVTGSSFVEHNPQFPFRILIADEFEPPEGEYMGSLIRMSDLSIPHITDMCFRYTELELSYALTPYVIKYLFKLGYKKVLFLKQETLVLGDLESIFSRLDIASAAVTPHFLKPPTRADALIWEINVLRSGVINGGVIGFSDTPESNAFLSWWQDRLATECLLDVDNGLHYEQRWLDFLPIFVPNFYSITDPGINVGHWNIHDRDVRLKKGVFEVDGHKLRIFRFSGFDYENPKKLTRYDNRDVSEIGDANLVVDRYLDALVNARHSHYIAQEYTYDRYDNNEKILLEDRLAYRSFAGDMTRFGDPFSTRSILSFYRSNKWNRSIYARVLRSIRKWILKLMR